jgi:hypothetical protein
MLGGAVSGTVRFLCHIPTFYLAIFGTSQYKYVNKHAQILLVPPYKKHKIMTAMGFLGPGVSLCNGFLRAGMLMPMQAIVVLIWNFFFWIPTIMATNEILFYFGLVDAAIVSCLSYGLYIESTFVGLTRPQCASVHTNATSDSHLLFFDRAGSINVTDTGLGPSTCRSFLVNWYMALTIMY